MLIDKIGWIILKCQMNKIVEIEQSEKKDLFGK